MKTILLIFTLFSITSCLPDNQDHSKCQPDNKVKRKQVLLKFQNGDIEKFYYKKRKSVIFVEEDIAIEKSKKHKQKGIIRIGGNWDNNIVYYFIEDNNLRDTVEKAVAIWHEKLEGAIDFIEVKTKDEQENYINIKKADGCWSYVGMIRGPQDMSLGKGCNVGTAVHEFGHALGLWHEQSRSDRDDYIEVKWCNIKEDKIDNFKKRVSSRDQDVGPYNYGSVMHYGRGFFSKNLKITLKSKTETPISFDHPDEPNSLDVAAIRCLYKIDQDCN